MTEQSWRTITEMEKILGESTARLNDAEEWISELGEIIVKIIDA